MQENENVLGEFSLYKNSHVIYIRIKKDKNKNKKRYTRTTLFPKFFAVKPKLGFTTTCLDGSRKL